MEFYTGTGNSLSLCSVCIVNDSLLIDTNGVDDCTVQVLPIETDEGYVKYNHVSGKLLVPYPSCDFKVLFTKHNSAPVWNLPPFDAYYQNKSVTGTITLDANRLYMGKNVTDDVEEGECVIRSGANVTIDAKEAVVDKGTVVEVGASLIINTQ